MSYPSKDETGNEYGDLTVLRTAKRPANKLTHGQYWLCRCKCGRERVAVGHTLRLGRMFNCGHLDCEYRRARMRYLPRGEAAFRVLLVNYKKSARRRGLSWELTREQFRSLTERLCHYCGIAPYMEAHVVSMQRKYDYGSYVYNGVDRVDSALGYSLENCVPCCKHCNIAKNNMSLGEFVEWAVRLGERLKETYGMYLDKEPHE